MNSEGVRVIPAPDEWPPVLPTFEMTELNDPSEIERWDMLARRMNGLLGKGKHEAGLSYFDQMMEMGEIPAGKDASYVGEAYYIGYQCAKGMGDLERAYELGIRAHQIDPENQGAILIEEVLNESGQVRIKLPKDQSDAHLVPALTPMAMHHRKAIEFANTQLAETGSFEGRLPVGQYTLGDYSFEVKNDGSIVEVGKVKQKREKAQRQPREKRGREVEAPAAPAELEGNFPSLGPSAELFLAAGDYPEMNQAAVNTGYTGNCECDLGYNTRYKGHMEDGVPQGVGQETSENYEYFGEFNDGRFEGKGRVSTENGFLYDGEWSGNQPDGEGLIQVPGQDSPMEVTFTKGVANIEVAGQTYEVKWANGDSGFEMKEVASLDEQLNAELDMLGGTPNLFMDQGPKNARYQAGDRLALDNLLAILDGAESSEHAELERQLNRVSEFQNQVGLLMDDFGDIQAQMKELHRKGPDNPDYESTLDSLLAEARTLQITADNLRANKEYRHIVTYDFLHEDARRFVAAFYGNRSAFDTDLAQQIAVLENGLF